MGFGVQGRTSCCDPVSLPSRTLNGLITTSTRDAPVPSHESGLPLASQKDAER